MVNTVRFFLVSFCLILAVTLAGCAPSASQATQAPAATAAPALTEAPVVTTEEPTPVEAQTEASVVTVEPPTEAPAVATEAPVVTVEPPAEAPALDGAALLESRCSECHSAGKAKQAKKTLAQWDSTVSRMIGKGASLSEAEKLALIEYLAKTYGP